MSELLDKFQNILEKKGTLFFDVIQYNSIPPSLVGT
jgi:hypothetical protein